MYGPRKAIPFEFLGTLLKGIMKLDINFNIGWKRDGLPAFISTVLTNQEKIMNNQAENEAKLDAIGTSLDNISADSSGLQALILELREEVLTAGNLPQSFVDKLDALQVKATSIDEAVDAIAPNPTPTPETP